MVHRTARKITITTVITIITVITVTAITAIIPAVTTIRQKLQQLLHRPLKRQISIPMLIRLWLINYQILLKILLIKQY